MLKSGKRPAACQVEPAVSSERSSRTTSDQPFFVRGYSVLTPTPPPPITPPRACVLIFICPAALKPLQCSQRTAGQSSQLRQPLIRIRPSESLPWSAQAPNGRDMSRADKLHVDFRHAGQSAAYNWLNQEGMRHGLRRSDPQEPLRLCDAAELLAHRAHERDRTAAHGEYAVRSKRVRGVHRESGWCAGGR